MANISRVTIRFARHGCANRPYFQIVAIQAYRGQKSKGYLEQLGTYDPMPNNHNERLVSMNIERIQHWLASGADISRPVAMLLGMSGLLPIHPVTYIHARRARNKTEVRERLAAAALEEDAEQKEES